MHCLADLLHTTVAIICIVETAFVNIVYKVRNWRLDMGGIQRRQEIFSLGIEQDNEPLKSLKAKLKKKTNNICEKTVHGLWKLIWRPSKVLYTLIYSQGHIWEPRYTHCPMQWKPDSRKGQKIFQYQKQTNFKIFSYEKNLYHWAVLNCYNDQFIAKPPSIVKGVWGLTPSSSRGTWSHTIWWNKDTSPFSSLEKRWSLKFIIKSCNIRFGPDLTTSMIIMCGHKMVFLFIWQRKCRNSVEDNFADFWPINFRPSSSPDLRPLDHAIWGKVEHSTKRTSHPSVYHLKQVLREEWDNVKVLHCEELTLQKTCEGCGGQWRQTSLYTPIKLC